MPIISSLYVVTNVRQRNLVTLPDPNDGTPLVAGIRKDGCYEQWFVELQSNETYSIRNIRHEGSFANAGSRAKLGDTVEGRSEEQYWIIQETRDAGQYTISTTDTRVFWALEDRELGTPITLLASPTDKRCWWTFEDASPGAIARRKRRNRYRNNNRNSKVGTSDLVITGDPMPDDAVAIDIPSTISEPTDLLDSLTVSEATIPNPTIAAPILTNRLAPKATIPYTIIKNPLSSSQPKLGAVIRAPVIRNHSSSRQSRRNTALILHDISFTTSQSNGLLDPLTKISKALEKVLSTAEITFKSDREWKIPIRRLRFHLDTIKHHCVELEKDFKIDGIVPTLETTIIGPLEEYANEIRKVYRAICDDGTVHPSVSKLESEEARNKEAIGQRIRNMDLVFEQYTTGLYGFAEQAYKDMQELPQVGQGHGLEVIIPHHTQSRRPNAYGIQHKECLSGTRQKTLNAIRKWANDTSGAKPTFLLLDVAGSGKSTVAKTMAEELGRDRLVARYFFSRDTTATRSTESFCLTVSAAFLALAPKPEGLKPEDLTLKGLIEEFKKRPDFNLLSFKELFHGLVVGPLEKLSLNAILIIDALDECDDEDESCTDLLNAICSHRSSTPRLRILATGRPELHITNWANRYNIEWHNFFRLEGTNKDVDLYIQQTLQNLPSIHATVQKLANGLFIWARIACDLICKTADINRLLRELETAVSLDYLYQVALNQSVPKDEGSRRVFVVVLQMILTSREPLSTAELEKLAPEPHIVDQIVTRLGALLVYQHREDPIRLLHITFREFLTTARKADRYFIQLENGHHTLTLGCLKAIEYHSPQEDDKISKQEEISFLTGYILTVYLGFTFTRQSRGCITV